MPEALKVRINAPLHLLPASCWVQGDELLMSTSTLKECRQILYDPVAKSVPWHYIKQKKQSLLKATQAAISGLTWTSRRAPSAHLSSLCFCPCLSHSLFPDWTFSFPPFPDVSACHLWRCCHWQRGQGRGHHWRSLNPGLIGCFPLCPRPLEWQHAGAR